MTDHNPLHSFLDKSNPDATQIVSNQDNSTNSSKIVLILGIIILLCLFITCCVSVSFFVYNQNQSKDSNKSSSENDSKKDAPKEKADSQDEDDEPQTPSLTPTPGNQGGNNSNSGQTSVSGEKAAVGETEWTVVKSINFGSTLQNPTEPSLSVDSEGQFIKIYFEVKNLGNSIVLLDEPKLRDGSGKIYDSYPGSFFYIDYPTEETIFLSELGPGESMSFIAIYEADKGSNKFSLQVTYDDYSGKPREEKFIDLKF